MPTIKRTFLNGKMNLDIDERLMPDGDYGEALNIRIANSEGSDVGAIEKSLSNLQLTSLALGNNVYTLGSLRDEFEEKIYWAVLSDNGCYIIEYEVGTDTTTVVLEDTRSGASNVLGFVPNKLLQMVLIVDSDNNNRLLAFTDNNTQPKCINVERAKTYGANGFNEEMILLIKKPPLYSPTIILSDTGDEENNIEEKFIQFAYRYKYLDGEYSALSPFSDYAFMVKSFNYDYSIQVNESMMNLYNSVQISFNTGSDLVTDIEVIFKESGSNTVYLVEKYNKTKKTWADNTTQSIDFTNNKIYKVLPEKELFRLYDNVPLLAQALTVINNRIVFGNYTENYDLVDNLDADVNVDLSLEQITTAITSPVKSIKSNRNYEVAIAYLDDYGRMTTPLTSENNTIYIPNTDSVNQNEINVIVPHKPPAFATKYRFFIKQTKQDYETIVPTLFYEDGMFVWIKLEGSDKDKIKDGDFLYVKSDTQGLLTNLVQTKVLDIKQQERNFLNPDEITDTLQLSGLYFKIKPSNFRLDTDDFTNYYFEKLLFESVTGSPTVIEKASWYGIGGLNDLTQSGTYTGTTDIRYIVEIDALGTPDTFRWSNDDGGSWTSGVAITGAAQLLELGVSVTFGATTGHDLNDSWIVSAKATFGATPFAFFKSLESNGNINVDDVILGGARIRLKGIVYQTDYINFDEPFTSSRQYDNLEEWFYGDNIGSSLALLGISESSIKFRRGTYISSTFSQNATGDMCLLIEADDTLHLTRAEIEIFQSEQNVILETKPIETNSDIFYEIGQTYAITGGYHIGNGGSDINQSSGVDAEIVLPFYNCFSWGNGFESYKIKDEFNAKSMKADTRPSVPIDNYRQNKRIAGYTWSNVYEQTTNYNAINEFNLALVNYNDLDDKYGAIQAMESWDNDLDIWQEDKVTKVLYDKRVIYNGDGTSNLAATNDILINTIPYSGEFGISTNPESLSVFGNYSYWADAKRGVFLRKGQSGIEIISNFGIRNFTRDEMISLSTFILGGYDPYFGQFVISLNNKTLTFDEKVKGWTSFHSWIPDEMVRINNRFYTIKDGQLYLHNDDTNDVVNTFYGVQYPSRIQTFFNEAPSEDKIFKNVIEEGTNSWKATIVTNLTNGVIEASEFKQKESKWIAYTRKNESATDLTDRVQGIGNILNVSSSNITFGQIPTLVSVGEVLYQLNGSSQEQIGVITNINKTTAVITVATIITTPNVGLFAYSVKDARVQGSELRGYYAKVTFENSDDENVELFAVNMNIAQSYVPTEFK